MEGFEYIPWAEIKTMFVCPLPTYLQFIPLPKKILQFPEEKYFFYFSMASMYDLSFIKSFKCLYTNLLNLPFLENLCTVCEISIHLFHTCPYYMYK